MKVMNDDGLYTVCKDSESWFTMNESSPWSTMQPMQNYINWLTNVNIDNYHQIPAFNGYNRRRRTADLGLAHLQSDYVLKQISRHWSQPLIFRQVSQHFCLAPDMRLTDVHFGEVKNTKHELTKSTTNFTLRNNCQMRVDNRQRVSQFSWSDMKVFVFHLSRSQNSAQKAEPLVG